MKPAHDATGRIVARTKLAFEADDDTHARQRITIVERSTEVGVSA